MYTFPKKLLFQKADFDALFKAGQKKFGAFFIVYSRLLQHESERVPDPRPAQTYSACGLRNPRSEDREPSPTQVFGLVVGKKATGNNVKRNLVKRLIREAYRLHQHELSHLQILVLAKKGLKDVDRKALRTDLEKLLAFYCKKTGLEQSLSAEWDSEEDDAAFKAL